MKFKGREKEYRREWWAKNKGKQKDYRKRVSPEKQSAQWRQRTYGVSPEQWALLSQHGCGICGSTEKLVVDHCHATGQVRGALCQKHNVGLGAFNDDPDVLRRAIEWLERKR
jgi:Recombination endonuclease VII